MSETPSTGRIDNGLHRLAVRVYYEDTDFSGVVYHAAYLKFLERGRSEFLRCAGVRHAELLASRDPAVFAVRSLTIDFERPAKIDDALVVETRFEAARGARLLISQTIFRGAQRLIAARVEAVCLTLDGRPRRAPAAVRDAIAPHLTGVGS